MALKTGLEGKPWYIGLAVGLGIGGLLFGAGYWRLLDPMRDDFERAETQLKGLQGKIQEGRAAKEELPKFREEVRQLELELDKLLRILPARRNTPDLMRRIRSLAEQGDFSLRKFNPLTLSDKEFFSEWPINVDVEGSYHNLALFFDRISRFSRIINVEDLEIKAMPPPKVVPAGTKGAKEAQSALVNQHTITATFTAKTFVYKEPEADNPEADAKGKNGKDKKGPTAPPKKGGPAADGEGPASRIRSGGAPPGGGPD
ncbi:MAG TPA: type 4a pilus biogenesis protein PilO [Thermoanaerobaculia bacterium]